MILFWIQVINIILTLIMKLSFSLQGWKKGTFQSMGSPTLYRAKFEITDDPKDTFIDMTGWHKGIVFVNSFNLGRYWKIGPQAALYVPAPLLVTGTNTVSSSLNQNVSNNYEYLMNEKHRKH